MHVVLRLMPFLADLKIFMVPHKYARVLFFNMYFEVLQSTPSMYCVRLSLIIAYLNGWEDAWMRSITITGNK